MSAAAATTEQMKLLLNSLQKLLSEVLSLEGNCCYLTLDCDFIIIEAGPNKGLSNYIVPINYKKSTYFD